jgi:hypothetical protein
MKSLIFRQEIDEKRSLSTPTYYAGPCSLAPKTQYCTVNANHTACLYAGTNETRCGTTGRIRGLTAAEKDAIVSAHNDKRRTVANGQQANQPPAANMIKMVRLSPKEFHLHRKKICF